MTSRTERRSDDVTGLVQQQASAGARKRYMERIGKPLIGVTIENESRYRLDQQGMELIAQFAQMAACLRQAFVRELCCDPKTNKGGSLRMKRYLAMSFSSGRDS